VLSKISNQIDALDNKPNLVGLSKSEIMDRFGSPYREDTSYLGDTRLDTWIYIPEHGRYIFIHFKDDVVNRISY
jgi:hypothetical protein